MKIKNCHLLQCYVRQHDHGRHSFVLGAAKPSSCPPGPWFARGSAALSPTQGEAAIPAWSTLDYCLRIIELVDSVFHICSLSQGVVRIHLLEAQSLAAKDNYVKGVMAGLSDPYAILRVGPQTFTSKHIDNTDSPKWGEMYEVRNSRYVLKRLKMYVIHLHH